MLYSIKLNNTEDLAVNTWQIGGSNKTDQAKPHHDIVEYEVKRPDPLTRIV